MIHIENFTKKYRKQIAVDNISMDIESGDITLLLGPNGAGKSTTVKSIAGLLNYEGKITICNHPNKSLEAKRIFGYIPENPALYDLLTIEEHIHFISKAYDLGSEAIDRANKYLDILELTDQKKKLARELSKGMLQKVSICLALMIDPQVILIDEPMIGLDPKAIENLVMVTGDDPILGVHTLKKYIVHTHAKDGIMKKKTDPKIIYDYFAEGGIEDFRLSDYFEETPFGAGAVNIHKWVIALKEIGYKGFITIERETGERSLDELSQCISILRKELAFNG
jgi:ABC-2 type transport system ATP-binding protein